MAGTHAEACVRSAAPPCLGAAVEADPPHPRQLAEVVGDALEGVATFGHSCLLVTSRQRGSIRPTLRRKAVATRPSSWPSVTWAFIRTMASSLSSALTASTTRRKASASIESSLSSLTTITTFCEPNSSSGSSSRVYSPVSSCGSVVNASTASASPLSRAAYCAPECERRERRRWSGRRPAGDPRGRGTGSRTRAGRRARSRPACARSAMVVRSFSSANDVVVAMASLFWNGVISLIAMSWVCVVGPGLLVGLVGVEPGDLLAGDDREHGAGVGDVPVDVAVAQRLVEVLGRADALAQVDGVPVDRERLPPQLAEDARLGELLGADGDAQRRPLRLLRGAALAVGCRRTRRPGPPAPPGRH